MGMKLIRWSLAIVLLALVAPTLSYAQGARQSAFEYDPKGLLTAEIIEPGAADLCVRTEHRTDAYGNRENTTISNCPGAGAGALFASRATTTEYKSYAITVSGMSVQVAAGAHATKVTNALGHTEQRLYDPRFGGLASLTGPNGLTTTWQYDALGRKVLEIAPDGNRIATRHCLLAGQGDASANSAGCHPSPPYAPAYAVSYLETQPQDAAGAPSGPYLRKYADSLGRVVREEAQGYDGPAQPASFRIIVKDSEYNEYGALVRATQPFFADSAEWSSLAGSGAAAGFTTTLYDMEGRPAVVDIRDNSGNSTSLGQVTTRKTFAYSGLSVAATVFRASKNAQGQNQPSEALTTTSVSDVLGEVIEIKDAKGAVLRKRYDAFGNLVQTQDAHDNRVRMTYDARGRRTQMEDPNAGTWKYRYNALGEVTGQQSPNQAATGTWTTMSYDALGRLVQRAEPGDYVTTWTYDTCSKGIGKLCQAVTDHGVTKNFTYDSFGRPASVAQQVAGQPAGFVAATAYDTKGRVASHTYPTGASLAYVYTPLGFAAEIYRGAELVWRMGMVNAWGRPQAFDLGANSAQNTRNQYDPVTGRLTRITAGPSGGILDQSYGWDTVGNLTSRSDRYDEAGNVLSETFGYDQLDRLVNYQTSAPTLPGVSKNVTLTHYATGSITSKSDVGTFQYPSGGNGAVRPGAVASISGGAAGTRSYTYDAAGNLVGASGSRYTSLTYTSFNLPRTLSGSTANYDWGYGPDHERVRETRTAAGNSRVTWYFHPDKANGLAFEQEVLNGATPVNRHYVSAMGRTVMVFETSGAIGSPSAQTQTSAQYWHVDQLGSVSAIANATGQLVQRYSYDPFGKRRNLNGAYDGSGTIIHDQVGGQSTDRGFTGHEHLDDVGIVHMNGRTFDPLIGRFMQPDPFIQFENNAQSYNRYSYVLNNPLKYTDPSGEFIPIIFAYVGSQIAMHAMAGTLLSAFTQAFIAGAVGGALSSFTVKGANPIKGAIAGGVTAAAFSFVGSAGPWSGSPSPATAFESWFAKTVAHAATGCATSAAFGGDCKSGAIGAGASASLGFATDNATWGDAEQTLVRAIIGGTASTAAGGKFQNGALSAAMGYLFNDLGHGPQVDAGSLSGGGFKITLDTVTNFAAGTGDTLSFGGTAAIRTTFDIGNVDRSSMAYSTGEVTGFGISVLTGGGVGLRLGGAAAKGLEFSHWWPNRWGGPRSLYNGNFVTKVEHALSDPYRYRFMARSWKATNPLPSPIIQQWNRIPWVWKGAGAGAAYGGFSLGRE